MNRKISNAWCGTLLCVAFGLSAVLAAEDGKPVGTLVIGEKSYKLSHLVAYEVRQADETLFAVLASDRALPLEKLKQALADGKKNDEGFSLSQPHVKITFNKAGEVQFATGSADNASFSDSKVQGALKVESGRVAGEAKLAEEGKFKHGLDLKFDVPLFDPAAPLAATPAVAQKIGVSGVFKGNGKEARLAYVSARRGEPFSDKPSIVLIFTEKDHSRDKRPDFKAGFGDFGSALVISCFEDGKIFGCEVAHAAHTKKPFITRRVSA